MVNEMTFDGDGTPHGATYEACAWLKSNGYSYGSSSVDGPTGVLKGEGIYIAKWRNLSAKERKEMDGLLHTGYGRPARLILREKPEPNRWNWR